jgi:predicted transcriptional regulator
VSDILTAISDDKSLLLFNTVALSSSNTDILITKLGLTRKQYYSRMSALTNAGLVSRSNGKYSLTSFGKVVNEAQLLIEKAKQYYWKLRAIDSIESFARGLSLEERSKIIETLIVEDDLKEILLGRKKTNLVEKRPLMAPDQKQQSRRPLIGINNT